MKNSNFSKACREISQNLLQITEPTKSNAKSRSKEFVRNIRWIKYQKTMKSYQRWMENRMKNSKRFY